MAKESGKKKFILFSIIVFSIFLAGIGLLLTFLFSRRDRKTSKGPVGKSGSDGVCYYTIGSFKDDETYDGTDNVLITATDDITINMNESDGYYIIIYNSSENSITITLNNNSSTIESGDIIKIINNKILNSVKNNILTY